MRKVVGSNYLRTDELRDYLSKSRTNNTVITDYAETEMLKASILEAIFEICGSEKIGDPLPFALIARRSLPHGKFGQITHAGLPPWVVGPLSSMPLPSGSCR
jgi:hypothetical protein